VRHVVAIEGLGPGPGQDGVAEQKPIAERMRLWIDAQRGLSGRQPRRYPTVEAAYARMQEENKHLTPEQARHLTQYGVNQNEDGTYSWKFDHYVRLWPPYDMTRDAIAELWGAITCPTLLVYGTESWATNPAEDGRLAYFSNARVLGVQRAGHWVHHDQLDFFLRSVRTFLSQP
jgi:pimeloyl-ACP methyl ester carboxylesterase